jgi:hypothetical protein
VQTNCQRILVGQAHRLPRIKEPVVGKLANFFGVRCRRARINRLGQFDTANWPRVERVQPELDYPEHRATSDVAIHLSVVVDQNNPAANSTLPLVLGESAVSVLPKNSQASHREHLLAEQ